MSSTGRHRRRTSRNTSWVLGLVPTLGAVVGFSAATAPAPGPAASAPTRAAAPAPGTALDSPGAAAPAPGTATDPARAASTPPASTPPASTPPASTPPASTPPASAPPASGRAPVPARTAGTPCAATVRACVDLGARKAWLTDGAGHVTHGPVAARGGSRDAPTPTGTYRVRYKDRDHWSRQFDAPMPYSVFFYPGVATHADNPRTASNGCVHLTRADAKRFYTGVRPGDRIQVVR